MASRRFLPGSRSDLWVSRAVQPNVAGHGVMWQVGAFFLEQLSVCRATQGKRASGGSLRTWQGARRGCGHEAGGLVHGINAVPN